MNPVQNRNSAAAYSAVVNKPGTTVVS